MTRFFSLLLSLTLISILGNTKTTLVDKFTTQDYVEYFSNETCYEFQYTQKTRPRLDKIKNSHREQLYSILKKSENNNKKALYKLIEKTCKSKLLRSELLQTYKFNMIVKLEPSSELERYAKKKWCNRKKDDNCPYKLDFDILDKVIRSKQYYIHEFFRYSLKQYFKKNLSIKLAKYLKTGHTKLAYHLLNDAYIIYQCKIGRDCSSTSTFMVEKCIIDEEFCGLDVTTYYTQYKHSLNQAKDIKKAVEFLQKY